MISRILDTLAHAADRLLARVWPAPVRPPIPEHITAEYVRMYNAGVCVEPIAPAEPTPLRRGESVVCPTCAAPAGRSCVYLRTARKGQFCAPHQARLDAERPPTRRAASGADPVEVTR